MKSIREKNQARLSRTISPIIRLVALAFFALTFLNVDAHANALNKVALGSMEEYTRLVFTFDEQINDVILRRDDVDTFSVDFGDIDYSGNSVGPTDQLVKSVSVKKDGLRLTSEVTLNTTKFEVRHFLSRDRFSCIVDFKNLSDPQEDLTPIEDDPSQIHDEYERLLFEPRPFLDVVESLSLFIVSSENDKEPERLVQSALADLAAERLDQGIQKLETFKNQYPNHPYNDPALFIIGDAYFAKGLPDNFTPATEAWTFAKQSFPDSFTAPRACYMIAEANRLMGYFNEAAGFYKLCATEYPDSDFTPISTLKATDMELSMGLNDQARKTVAPLLTGDASNFIKLLALARSGMADYQDTLYSQACEKFREALDKDPDLFQSYPEMLYAIGDSYSYLKRPDLTFMFLEHALNLMPDHPKADVMLARMGNALQFMNRQEEAISYFNAAKDSYPDRDGGLVSQIRLADMGALSAFFNAEQVFDALERGARQATVKMYDKIIGQASESPLLQLAYLKIGQAQAADGENGEAIKWLRELVTKYPKGVLLDEAKPILSRAVVNEAQENFDLERYKEVEILSSDNYSFLEGPDLLRFQRLLAESFENMNRPNDALEIWKLIEEQSPQRRLSDQKQLVEAALKALKPLEAFDQIKSTLTEFPAETQWANDKIAEVAQVLADLSRKGSVDELLAFREDELVSPLTEVGRASLENAITILVNQQHYDQASALMDAYRSQYPDDELSPEYLLTQVKIDRRAGLVDKSWNRLSDFRVEYPDDPRTPQTILDTVADARNLGRLDDAFRYEELYRQLYPNDLDSRNMILKRAQELYNLGRTEDSLATLEYFQTQYPDDPGTPATFVDQYRKLVADEKIADAKRALDKLRELFPDDPVSKESYVIEYRDLIRLNQPQDAFDLLSEFQNYFPDDFRQPAMLLEQARDYFALGRSNDGINAWRKFLDLYPNDERVPELLLILARREIKENLPNQAVSHFRDYLENFPNRPDRPQVLLELAGYEKNQGMNNDAYNDLNAFRREFPQRPEEAQVLLEQAGLASAMNRLDDAANLFDLFRSTFPNHPKYADSFLDQSRNEMASGDTARALATLERGIINNPGLDNPKQVQDLLLNLYLDEGRVEDWAGALEEYLGRDANPSANLADRYAKYSQIAQVYQELGRQQDASKNFDLALANRPPEASGESLYTIAGAYKKMGLDEQYRSVLQIIQTLPDPLWQNVANEELNNLG